MKRKSYVFETVQIIYRESPLRLLLCVVLLMLVSLFTPLYLFSANRLIISLQQGERVLIHVCFFVFALMLSNSKSLVNLLGSYLWITAEIALQRTLIKKAAQQPLINYDTPSLYERIERAMDSYGNAVGSVMMLISAIFISAFSAATICVYLTGIHPLFGLILLAAMGIKVISYRRTSENVRLVRREKAQKKAQMLAFEEHAWHKETRAFGAARYFLNQWKEVAIHLHELEYRTEMKNRMILGVQDVLTYLVYAGAICCAMVVQKTTGEIQIGALIVLFLAMEMVYSGMDTVVAQVGNTLQSGALSKDLFDFIDDDSAKAVQKHITGKAAVELKDVCFSYPTAQHEALSSICLSINQGERIALVGRNGSGKSTLVKLLCGLYAPTKGTIQWGDGMHFEADTGRNISAVFQDVQTYNMTLRENVSISSVEHDRDERRIVTSLEQAFGLQWLSGYKDGLDTVIGTRFGGVDLSGGEKQRLAIARAYFRPYTMIFLDEPSSAMDALSEKCLYEDFLRISEGKTSVYITHRLSSVRHADRIIVLSDGRITEQGSHEELINQGGLYAQMYSMQKEEYD